MFEEFLLPDDLSRRELIATQKIIRKRLRERSSVNEVLFQEALDKLRENWERLSTEEETQIIKITDRF